MFHSAVKMNIFSFQLFPLSALFDVKGTKEKLYSWTKATIHWERKALVSGVKIFPFLALGIYAWLYSADLPSCSFLGNSSIRMMFLKVLQQGLNWRGRNPLSISSHNKLFCGDLSGWQENLRLYLFPTWKCFIRI